MTLHENQEQIRLRLEDVVLVNVKKHHQKIPFARNGSGGRINHLIVQLKDNFPEETKYKTVAFASTESEMNLVLKNNWSV